MIEMLPRLDHGHVLITSRRTRWPRGVGKVDVDVLLHALEDVREET